jgi:outer membrane protein assembly factor BamB
MKHLLIPALALLTTALPAAEPPREITIAGEGIFTESLTSTRDGTVIVGSETRVIFRARPGEREATPWIELPPDSPRSVYGVFADESRDRLWACTGTIGDVPSPPPPGTLYTFDLATGKPRGAFPLPHRDAICNDIAVGDDGSVYVTDTPNMLIARLAPGAMRLEVWADRGFGKKGDVIDGIAVLGNRVIVNTLLTAKLFAVDIARDGTAGAVTPLALDEPISRPDGMRAIGPSTILLGESVAGGRVLRIEVARDRATVERIDTPPLPNGAVAVTAAGAQAWALDPTVRADGKLRRFRAVPLSPRELAERASSRPTAGSVPR